MLSNKATNVIYMASILRSVNKSSAETESTTHFLRDVKGLDEGHKYVETNLNGILYKDEMVHILKDDYEVRITYRICSINFLLPIFYLTSAITTFH